MNGTDIHFMVEIKAKTGDTSGEALVERAKDDLNVWGGMSHSEGVVDDEGFIRISFDPDLAEGGPAAILRWLDDMGIEYEALFMRWVDR